MYLENYVFFRNLSLFSMLFLRQKRCIFIFMSSLQLLLPKETKKKLFATLSSMYLIKSTNYKRLICTWFRKIPVPVDLFGSNARLLSFSSRLENIASFFFSERFIFFPDICTTNDGVISCVHSVHLNGLRMHSILLVLFIISISNFRFVALSRFYVRKFESKTSRST